MKTTLTALCLILCFAGQAQYKKFSHPGDTGVSIPSSGYPMVTVDSSVWMLRSVVEAQFKDILSKKWFSLNGVEFYRKDFVDTLLKDERDFAQKMFHAAMNESK